MKGLYFHIPFCRSRCPYCDFYSLLPNDYIDKYVSSVTVEIVTGRRTAEFTKYSDLSFDTVYFGGGTPSLIGGEKLCEILNTAKNHYHISDNAEITVECNPSAVGNDFFRRIAEGGFNRVSIGLQSAVDSERRALGRLSGADEVQKTVDRALRSGITNISLDIMLGIPNQTIESLDRTLDFCVNSGAKHISAYILTLEENTVFYKRREKLHLPDEDAVCEMYLHAAERLEKVGFCQYEISNFAKSGFESRHNLKYWNDEEYLGLGASAHSFINGKRFYFPRSAAGFIDGQSAVFDCDGGGGDEYIMLRLRLSEGLIFGDYEQRYSSPLPRGVTEKAAEFEKQGLISLDNERIALTKKGFLMSNYIISELLAEI